MGPSRGPLHQPLAVHEPSPALPETLSRPDPAGLPSPTPVSWRSPSFLASLLHMLAELGRPPRDWPPCTPLVSLTVGPESGESGQHAAERGALSSRPAAAHGVIRARCSDSDCPCPVKSLRPPPRFLCRKPPLLAGSWAPPAEGRSLGECVARVKTKGDGYGFGEILSGCAASSLLPPTLPPVPQNQGEFLLPAHPSIPRPTALLSEALRMPPVCVCPS